MFRTFSRYSLIAMALGASLAVAQVAEAGGYAGNGCVSKKQGALGKYAKSVGKAWDKYPSDPVARGTAISDAFTKLDGAWLKAEAKAASKNASCTGSTSTSTVAATAIDDAATAVSGDQALTGYIAAAMKARGKYIKDPVKDPKKVNLEAAIDDAELDHLTGATMLVTDAADELESDLVELTTNAPNYPTTFQTISPTVCTASVCADGSNAACTTNSDCEELPYKKDVLTPLCVDGDPYIYFARKGTSNNVLMYYQGGGACWDQTSCFSVPGGTCSRTADANDNPDLAGTGFADYDNPANPFADWNIVFVTYCTCDVHWGDKFMSYPGAGHQARHYGRQNAAVAEKFAREHFVDPDKVFVTGSSAGSYGAIMNSYWLMKEVWPNADFSVLGDAGVGVITQGFLDEFIDNWGVTKNFPEDLPGVALPVTNLSLVDLIDGLAQAYPDARLANYDSSYDGGGGSQSQFFQVMRHPAPPANFITEWGTWWNSACEWNACMRAFKEENSTRASLDNNNYHYFTGAGSRHTMFGSDKVYTETKSTRNDTDAGMTIVDWINAMIDDTADWVDVDCNNPSGDCNLTNSCQGGDSPGAPCTTDADCTVGGTCQHDPDTANAPFNDDDTVNCPMTACSCGPAAAECVGGANDGLFCALATETADCPDGSCVFVRCPTFTP